MTKTSRACVCVLPVPSLPIKAQAQLDDMRTPVFDNNRAEHTMPLGRRYFHCALAAYARTPAPILLPPRIGKYM